MKKTEAKQNNHVLEGEVIGKSGLKTIKVKVENKKKHKILKKYFTLHRNYLVHDETGKVKVGQIVKIIAGRKISKNKSWYVVE